MMLAQVAGITSGTVGGVLDTVDRVSTMSAAGLCLVIAVLAGIVAVWSVRELGAEKARNAQLLEARAGKSEADLTARLAEQRADSAAHLAKVETLTRESDETLAMSMRTMDSLKAELEQHRKQAAELSREVALWRAQAERVERALAQKGA